jgi:hypothetical protein
MVLEGVRKAREKLIDLSMCNSILPVFRLVDPGELIEILRMPHGRRIETPEQVNILIEDICKIFSVSRSER